LSSVVERSNLEDALWKALQELAESNFLHRLRFWRGWGRELPAEIDRRLRPLEEAVSARSAPTETDCVAEDAVSCEPVSALLPWLTGKLTGNFVESGPPPRFSSLINATIQ
jgi:hypothetical protein